MDALIVGHSLLNLSQPARTPAATNNLRRNNQSPFDSASTLSMNVNTSTPTLLRNIGSTADNPATTNRLNNLPQGEAYNFANNSLNIYS